MPSGIHPGMPLFWVAFLLTTLLVNAQQCPPGQYWCGDRCGTETDTCCKTPSSSFNLCGSGTICCGFGCCPDSSFTCNADFSCTGSDGQVIPPVPNPSETDLPQPTSGLLSVSSIVASSNTETTEGVSSSSDIPVPPSSALGASSTAQISSVEPIDTQSSPLDPTVPTSSVVTIGTVRVTLPAVTSQTTLVTLSQTFTLVPPPDTTQQIPSSTRVTTGSESATSLIDPEPTTIVTSGSTFTILPLVSNSSPDSPSSTSSTTGTGSQDSTTRAVTSTHDQDTPPSSTDESQVTFTQWPSEAIITPVEVDVEKPEPSKDDDDSAVIPCKLWFFSVCIRFDDVNILGWKISLPPGVYLPGPPPIEIIKLPGPIRFESELPPWPKFTVGPDHVPTFPPEPEPTDCETKTASICSTTTSFIVSTVDGSPTTVSSMVLPPTCAELRGCLVADSTREASVTRTQCATETVTDVIVTCSGTGTPACSTRTELTRTGCEVTATTTTVSCNPASTGNSKRQQADGDSPSCPIRKIYVVWPRDGTKADETGAIYSEIKELVQDDDKIRVSEANGLGVNFWKVSMDADQAAKVKAIGNVASVHLECTSSCEDPTTADTNWRYQTTYLELEYLDKIAAKSHMWQMTYISSNEGEARDRLSEYYYFDVSAGEDIPVYVVDTGAQMTHVEFTEGDNIAAKTEFLFVGNDYDGQQHRDDSGTPLDGKCSRTYCNPHGTAMLSAIAGSNLGIAKKVKPVVVRVPRKAEQGGGASPEDYLEALVMVHNAFSDDSGTTRAILSLSWSYSPILYRDVWKHTNPESTEEEAAQSFDRYKKRMHAILTSLIRKGVFVVTGSGNSVVINSYPALFADESSELYIPELLVVGAADIATGVRWWKSGIRPDLNLPHIYAPGHNVVLAYGNISAPLELYKDSSGTSEATAYTAGLAAYFLKLHQLGRLGLDAQGNEPEMSPGGLKKYIIDKGWKRPAFGTQDATLGIWNGAAVKSLEENGYCRYKPGEASVPKLRRQENDDILTGQCVPGTSSTATVSSGPGSTATATATPSAFVCTEETVDRCSPGIICSAPLRNGCENGRCACVLPSPPPTTLSTATSKPKPTPTEKTKVSLELGERHCNDASVYTGKGDIIDLALGRAVGGICGGTALEERRMFPGKKPLEFRTKTNGVPYFMSISWREGCETTVDSVLPADPLGGGKVECVDLFYDNWKKCTGNKGRGGYIDAGCLRYEFTPKE